MKNLRAWGLNLIVAYILYVLIAWIANAVRPWDITTGESIWNYIVMVIIVAILRGIVTGQYPGLKKENLKAKLKEIGPIPIAVLILLALFALIFAITSGDRKPVTLNFTLSMCCLACAFGFWIGMILGNLPELEEAQAEAVRLQRELDNLIKNIKRNQN